MKTKGTSMNKLEAIIALKEGKRISHRFFDTNEWIEMGGSGIICEDGTSISFEVFWDDRNHPFFDRNWFVVEKENHESLSDENVQMLTNEDKEATIALFEPNQTIIEKKDGGLIGINTNQKQFKEFNPELFKAYINKFKHEDLREAFSIIERKLEKDFGDKISITIT